MPMLWIIRDLRFPFNSNSGLRLSYFLLLFLCVSASLRGTSPAKSPPNVLFIAIDDLNCWAIDKNQYPRVQTPNIDRLRERGVTFTNAHCAVPACNPSRTALLTGVSPFVSGVYMNKQDWRECKNLADVVTLPEFFQNSGYKTMGGGKIYHAHSLSTEAHTGFIDAEPWDEYFPSKDQQMPLEVDPPVMPENGNPKFYGGHMDWSALDITDDEMADGKVVSWAEEQLTSEHDKPLFLAVGIYRPHVPWYNPKKWFELYPLEQVALPHVEEKDLDDTPEAGQKMARRHWQQWMIENDQWQKFVRAYLASVSFADAMVGRLLDALDNGPHAKNTVIVLWSDHGYHLGHKEHWEKFALWEQATRVPLIFAAPGIGGGDSTNRPASLLDIYPTLVDLTQGSPPSHLNGKSLAPWIENPKAPFKTPVITTHGSGNHAIRSERWRYIRYSDGTEELYDHSSDPHEFTNLAATPEHVAVIKEHRHWLPRSEVKADPPLTSQKKKG
ncbi:MAG: sulfatase [Verrucomicrobiota bacterium]